MRNIARLLLPALLFCTSSHLQAETTETWSTERCTALRQQVQTDAKAQNGKLQQQLQQYCTAENLTPAKIAANTTPNVMPVQLNVPPEPAPPQTPPPRVQHNSTLETLGSSMLLVLIGFWLWMGRK